MGGKVSQQVSQLPAITRPRIPGCMYRHAKTGGWYWRVAERHLPVEMRRGKRYVSLPLAPGEGQPATRSRQIAEAIRRHWWNGWKGQAVPLESKRMEDLLAEFEEWNRQKANPATARANASFARQFAAAKGIVKPWQIALQAVQEHLIDLRRAGAEPRTQQKHKCAISTFCRFLMVIHGVFDHNPATAAMVQRPEKNPPRYLTAEAEEHLLRQARRLVPELHDPIVFGLETGARLSEIMRACWSDVPDPVLPDSEVMLRASKTKNWRLVKISPRLREMLEGLTRRKPEDALFPLWRNKRTWIDKLIMATTGIYPFGTGKGTGRQWHLLRNTCAVNWARNGAEPWRLMAWLGHSDLRTMLNYINVARAAGHDQKRPPRRNTPSVGGAG